MVFNLNIGTNEAQSLQNSIQEELTRRGYISDDDTVMAEYITIMLINNKTSEQIDAELKDLIGNDYGGDTDGESFTSWLFAEADKKSQPPTEAAPAAKAPPTSTEVVASPSSTVPATDAGRKPQTQSGNRIGSAPLYNQALNQALSSTSPQANKRTASARSPSPTGGQPNKSRRTDVPTGPRAMSGGRSLLDRMGGRQQRNHMHQRDDIQARIEAVTAQGAQDQAMMNMAMNNGGMNGMMMPSPEMAAAAAMGGMVNPMALQEMMMNQMALMAQMANNMGMLGNMGQMMNGMMPPEGQNMNNQQNSGPQQRRGGSSNRGGRRGGAQGSGHRNVTHGNESSNAPSAPAPSTSAPALAAIQAPTPQPVVTAQTASAAAPRPGFTPPDRPQSPSLCKFGLKCTNALCRYSHPSPVATPESGMVLSKESCENGVKCSDKDCIKGHVSPAAVGVTSVQPKPEPVPVVAHTPSSTLKIPCRYGTGCLRMTSGCPYSHPFVPSKTQQPCRFGAACTRANCAFQHPPGRVLPGSFHRGLAENTPVVPVGTPETGSIGGPSPHRSVVFNKPVPKKEGEAGGAAQNKDKEARSATAAASDVKTVEAAA